MILSNKKHNLLFFLVFILFLGGVLAFADFNRKVETNITNGTDISYIPFGDSFTIGLGVLESQRWPNIMVESFAQEDVNIRILDNPSVSGHTVSDTINFQLPILKTLKPDFVTVFIGTNDSFVLTNVEVFEKSYAELLDKLELLLPKPKNMVLITIPDYSKFPSFRQYKNNVSYSESVYLYNEIIRRESVARGLVLADIYPVSQGMTEGVDFIFDGVHPAKAGYEKWERVIYPKVKELLFN